MVKKYLGEALFNLLHYFTIKNLGIMLLGAISLTILIIIIQLIRMLYLSLKLKHSLKGLKQINHLSLRRRNLTGYKSFKLSLSGPLTKQLNSYCLRNKITKSLYLETLLTESLQKGDKHNG